MDALNDPLDEIDASQRAQEEAIFVLLRTFVPREKRGECIGGTDAIARPGITSCG